MSYRVKKLTGSNLPGRWMVEVTYRDGSSPAIFTVEDLEDVDERIELDPDWIIITLNKCAPDPECRSGA